MIIFLALSASLCGFLLAATAESGSVIHPRLEPVSGKHRGLPPDRGQLPLGVSKDSSAFPSHRTGPPPPRHVNVLEHFDARENSVGVVFTTADEEADVLHLWLPLGKKVFTRDSPVLPLHPMTARINTLITTTPFLDAPEQLERIRCDIWTTAGDMVSGSSHGVSKQWKVSFSRLDGIIHFARESNKEFWLGGKEVVSYECYP